MIVSILLQLATIVCLQNVILGWKYQTKCTKSPQNTYQFENSNANSYSIVDEFERDSINYDSSSSTSKKMRLKCANLNDFLFIGLTQYGVAVKNKTNDLCEIKQDDCLVTVDYLSNECNGLNSCEIQLDSQFLHTCKNHSDYLSVAYECVPGAKRVDICSNEETFLIDPLHGNSDSLTSRFGSFYLSSPNYPNEYNNGLNNCSCKLEYVNIEENSKSSTHESKQNQINLVLKTYEFDLEEGDSTSHVDNLINQNLNHECTKDFLKVESFESGAQSNEFKLCGNYKEFKEFYAKGASFKLNLTSDDFLSRRGFLIKISPTAETICPYDSQKFDSKKCIKYFGDDNLINKRSIKTENNEKLNWFEAKKACESRYRNGRLLVVNDFVENFKLNSFIRNRLSDTVKSSLLLESATDIDSQNYEETLTSSKISFWSSIPIADSKNTKLNSLNIRLLNESSSNQNHKCMTKRLSYWQEESCMSKQAYICEFDAIEINKKTNSIIESNINNNKNRLIRVACGSSATLFSETTSMSNIVSSKKILKQNSIKNTQKPVKTNLFLPYNSKNVKNVKDEEMIVITPKEMLPLADNLILKIQNNTQHVETVTNTAHIQTSFLFGSDLALIIAIVSGASVVLIMVNIFCIWNYYKKKLRNFRKKDEQNYRTSTLIRGKLMNHNSPNRTMSSAVDSYIKAAPYELICMNNSNQTNSIEPMSSGCESLSTTGTDSVGSTSSTINQNNLIAFEQNQRKLEYLKGYFLQNKSDASITQQANHYYETLSKKEYSNSEQPLNNYNEYFQMDATNSNHQNHHHHHQQQFDSLVLLPSTASQLISSLTCSTMPINPTVVFLTHSQQEQLQKMQQHQQLTNIYGDAASSMTSNSSNQPLISFLGGSTTNA